MQVLRNAVIDTNVIATAFLSGHNAATLRAVNAIYDGAITPGEMTHIIVHGRIYTARQPVAAAGRRRGYKKIEFKGEKQG